MELIQPLSTILIANSVVVLSALVQTSTGMGFGMIAAPLLALVSLEFVPGPMLFVNLFLSLIMLGDGRANVVRHEITFLLPTILLGTIMGAAIVMLVPTDILGVLFALLIIIAVAVTVFAKALAITSRNLVICGVAVGIMGTATGIPGAPLVVLYQNEPIEKTRPTMALVFTFSYISSLVALSFAGVFSTSLALLGLMLLPGLIIGYVIGKQVRGYMTKAMGRFLMLSISSTGAVLLLLKSI